MAFVLKKMLSLQEKNTYLYMKKIYVAYLIVVGLLVVACKKESEKMFFHECNHKQMTDKYYMYQTIIKESEDGYCYLYRLCQNTTIPMRECDPNETLYSPILDQNGNMIQVPCDGEVSSIGEGDTIIRGRESFDAIRNVLQLEYERGYLLVPVDDYINYHVDTLGF